MKIGVIGLGNIAQKAYLPIYTKMGEEATFIFSTRNQKTRQKITKKYGLNEVTSTIEELIQSGISACFVHTSTMSHPIIVRQLLNAGIHVCVDKPLSQNLIEVKELLALAKKNHLLLMVGFNRRFAPLVEELKKVKKKNMLLIQKNRIHSSKKVEFVIYDLFLHVVDTTVYLLDDDIQSFQTKIIEENGFLKRAVLQIETLTTTAIATMNLCSGANTESYQVMSEAGTYYVENLTKYKDITSEGSTQKNEDDWLSTLEKRGFTQMVSSFIEAVKTTNQKLMKQEKVYTSHELCAEMIQQHAKDTH